VRYRDRQGRDTDTTREELKMVGLMPKISCPDDSDKQGNAQLARADQGPAEQPQQQQAPPLDPNAQKGAIVEVVASDEPLAGPSQPPETPQGSAGPPDGAKRPPELLTPPGEAIDIIGMFNDWCRTAWAVADTLTKGNARTLSAIPSESLPAINGALAKFFEYVNYAEGISRSIHNFAPGRHAINDTINWVGTLISGQSQESAVWNEHYDCWLREAARPIWVELRAPYATLNMALEAGIVKQLRDRTLEWVHEHCIAGRCPRALPAELDLGTANAGFIKHFQFKVQEYESTIVDLISGKKIPKVEVPKGVKQVMETLKEKKPAGEK
jgi:hypothetical protein